MKRIIIICMLLGISAFIFESESGAATETSIQKSSLPEKVQEFIIKAENGDPEAQNVLGTLYYQGKYVEKDEKKALEWLRKAANQNHPVALFNIATSYIDAQGELKISDEEYIKLMKMSSELGFSHAQYALSLMYWRGTYVEKNSVEAARLMRSAADQGLLKAQAQYGNDVYKGMYAHMPKNEEEGLKYLKLAGQGGHIKAALIVARHYHRQEKDAKEAIEWYKKAANGDIDAIKELYPLYLNGADNLFPNIIEACLLMSKHKELIERKRNAEGIEVLQGIVESVSSVIYNRAEKAIVWSSLSFHSAAKKGKTDPAGIKVSIRDLRENFKDIYSFFPERSQTEAILVRAMVEFERNQGVFDFWYESEPEKYETLRLALAEYSRSLILQICDEKLPSGKNLWEDISGSRSGDILDLCSQPLASINQEK